MKQRIYCAGSGGMLGEAFYRLLSKAYDVRCTDIDVNEPWLTYCDFRDYVTYEKDVVDFKPDFLFHLGAFTDLEFCEMHPDETYVTNTLAAEHAVHIANKLSIPLLYIGTAGIFDGEKLLYDDWDTPNPLGHYARSKFLGECFVRENCRQYLVCRAGWMMGGGPKKDKKFVAKIMKQIKDGKNRLYVVNDKMGTPTYTHDFARNVMHVLRTQYWGVYNMVCGGETGRFEVAQEIVHILGLEAKLQIEAVASDHFKNEYFAERPASERLVNKKLNLRKLNIMRDWRVALREYLASYYENYLTL